MFYVKFGSLYKYTHCQRVAIELSTDTWIYNLLNCELFKLFYLKVFGELFLNCRENL